MPLLAPESQKVRHFVDFLERQRRQGISLARIGSALGVTSVAVHQWLSGERKPSETVLILAELLERQQAGNWPL